MKKFKLLSLLSLLVVCAFSFFACSKNDVKSISFTNQTVQMYVDDYYDIAPIVAPANIKDLKLKYTTSDDNVAIVTPENKVFARGVGSAVITATAKNGVKGYLSVSVQEKQIKLEIPCNLRYNESLKRVEWDAVQNANSYTVFYGEEQETVSLTYWEGFAEAQNVSVKVRANGTSKYANSDQTTNACEFKVLATPTNLEFKKNYDGKENIIKWETNGGTKFKIKIGDVSSGPFEITTETAVYEDLDFTKAGDYSISVVSVGDGTIFDSRPSETIIVKKLANVSNINYVSATNLLSWDFVEGAKYIINIDGTENELTENNKIVNNLSRGTHQVSVRAVSGEPNIINSSIPCVKEISVWETLNAPRIDSYNELTNRLSLSNVGLATDFIVTVNGENTTFTQNSEHNIITFTSEVFAEAGDYTICVKAKGNASELLHDSAEATYAVKRLPSVSGLKIEQGNSIHWNTNANVTKYNVVLSDGSTNETHSNYASTDYNVFSRAIGSHTIKVQYKGNGNNLLDGAETSLSFTKIAMPTFVFDKTTKTITMSGESDHDFGISVNGNIITSSTSICDISHLLTAGSNSVFVYQVPKSGEIRSDNSLSQTIYVASQVTNLSHELIETYSYVSFNKTSQGDIKIMVDGVDCLFTIISQANSEYRIKLTNNTLFNTAKEYTISVGVISSIDDSFVDSSQASIKVTKLKKATNLSFASSTNTLTFNDLQDINNYQIILDGSVVESVSEKAYHFESLNLGYHTFKVRVVGNDTTTISSDDSAEIFDTKEQQLASPTISFDKVLKKLSISTTDVSVEKYDVYIGNNLIVNNQAKNVAGNVCDINIDDAGAYDIRVIAKNDNEYIKNGEQLIRINKLAIPTNIAFVLLNNVVSWNAVSGATNYKYKTASASEPIETATNSFSTNEFSVGEYFVSVQATSSDVNTIDGDWSGETSLQIKKALSAPSNLEYSKSAETLSFVAVDNASSYELSINGTKYADSETTSFSVPISTFVNSGNYVLSVFAKSENQFYTQGPSATTIVMKLAGPQNINISATEDVSVNYDATASSGAEIKVNNHSITSLAEENGEISVKVILKGKGDKYIDSTEKEFIVTRLAQPVATDIRVSGESISWTKNLNASGYKITINNGSSTYSQTINGKDNTTFSNYTFANAGIYDVTVQCLGNFSTYISSRASAIQTFTKLSAPTNLTIQENTECVLSFEAEGTNIKGYNIFVDNAFVVAGFNKSIIIPNTGESLLAKPGKHIIAVVSVGDNDEKTISSSKSQALNIERLPTLRNLVLSSGGVLSWTALSQLTNYSYRLYDKDDTLLDSNVIALNEIDLSTKIASNYDGIIKADVFATGNGSTILKSQSAFVSRTRTPMPSISATTEKIVASVDQGQSAYISVKKAESYIVENLLMENNQFVYPLDWTSGVYDFEVYTSKDGEIDSRKALKSLTKLATPQTPKFERSANSIVFSAQGVANASGYRVLINGVSKQTLASPQYTLATDGSISAGQKTFGLVALGIDGTSINSLPATITATKLSNQFAYSINENYQAVWSHITQSGFVTYEIYINDENKPNQTSTTFDLDSYDGGTIKIGVRAVGSLSDNYLDSDIKTGTVTKSIAPELSVNGTSVLVDNYQPGDIYNIDIYKNSNLIDSISNSSNMFKIDQSMQNGLYEFRVIRMQNGKVVSKQSSISHKKLASPTALTLSRSESNADIISFGWAEPVDASFGYKVYVDDTLLATINTASYALTSDISAGVHKLKVYAVGDKTTGFDSRFAELDVTKLSNDFDLRNESGRLTWEQITGTNILAYKLDINNSETVINDISTQVTSSSLTDLYGQLGLKIKAIGNINWNVIDSDYSSVLNIEKLDKPKNLTSVAGELAFDEIANAEKYLFVVDSREYDYLPGQSMATCLSYLTSDTEYTGVLKAYRQGYLTSDPSDSIRFKILENPSNNLSATYISSNSDATKYAFNFAMDLNASEYSINVTLVNNASLTPIRSRVFSSPFIISDAYKTPGDYLIDVSCVGSTGLNGGIHCFSSLRSEPISFKILETPTMALEKGVVYWDQIEFATKYYIYGSDSVVAEPLLTNFDFASLYNDNIDKQTINVRIRAVGSFGTTDGSSDYYLSSELSADNAFVLTKPRPPEMLVLSGGGLSFEEGEGVYTYYGPSENDAIYIEFMKNSVVVASTEIAVENFLNSFAWPKNNNYLEKYIESLPAGDYTMRIKQIGDNTSVLTSEWQMKTQQITVCPTPTNVVISNRVVGDETKHFMTWDAVTLDNYGLENTIYTIYVYDSIIQDWKYLKDVETNELDVTNMDGLLLTSYTRIAVVVKGNDDNYLRKYISGNMGGKLNITVLGEVSALRTEDGYLTWGVIGSALKYQIKGSGTAGWFVVDATESPRTYCDEMFIGTDGEPINPGEVTLSFSITALGNGSSDNGNCIINGAPSIERQFTKLATPNVFINNRAVQKWNEVNNALKYEVFRDGVSMGYIDITEYESDVEDKESHVYSYRAIGNSVAPTGSGSKAYISSIMSTEKSLSRYDRVQGLEVVDGVLYWSKSLSVASNKKYSIDFVDSNYNLNRIVVNGNENEKESFEIGNNLQPGTYTLTIREISASSIYISGLPSAEDFGINLLNCPQNVHLENGELVWDATSSVNYRLYLNDELISDENVENSPFISLSNGAQLKYVSNKASGDYKIKLMAVSNEPNTINSAFSNNNGEINADNLDNWVVKQIPALASSEIRGNMLDGKLHITWDYASSDNIPVDKKYQIWRTEKSEPETVITEDTKYEVDAMLKGIKVRTMALDEGVYFASVYSPAITITKPDPIENLVFDSTQQKFGWTSVGTGNDISYIVSFVKFETEDDANTALEAGVSALVDNENLQRKTVSLNEFAPMEKGYYVITVQVQLSGMITTDVGFSDYSEEPVKGQFNYFASGSGTSDAPFVVNESNVHNIMYRNKAYFVLEENLIFSGNPIGVVGGSVISFEGDFNGNGKTIQIGFANTVSINSYYIGLFARLGNGANVHDVVIDAKDVLLNNTAYASTTQYVGFVAGSVNGDGAVISRVKTIGNYKIKRSAGSETYIGGIAGIVINGSINNCENEAIGELDIKGYFSIYGGIAGKIENNANVEYCGNIASISGATYSAGIVAVNNGSVECCFNTGAILAKAFSQGNKEREGIAGGIVAYNGKDYSNAKIIACYNRATVSAENTTLNNSIDTIAGGIVGQTDGGKVNACYNTGIISGGTAQAIAGIINSFQETTYNYYLNDGTQTTEVTGFNTFAKAENEMIIGAFVTELNANIASGENVYKAQASQYPILDFESQSAWLALLASGI